MNVKKRMEHIAKLLIKNRRVGSTTVCAKAAKDIGALYLAANHQQAKYVQREHGVETRSIGINLDGFNGPFILDHYAASELLFSGVRKIEELQQEVNKLTEKLDRISAISRR